MYDNYSVKCGKLSFLDKESADRKIEQREFDRVDWSGRSYQCSKCSKWHITTRDRDEIASDSGLTSGYGSKNRRTMNSKPSVNTVEGSRIVNSFGEGNSGSSILDSVDKETLKKLGLK